MHYSAKRGIVIACRLSVRLSVCDVSGSGAQRLEILETNCTDTYRNTFSLRSPKAIHLLPGERGKILGRYRGGVGKSGVLEHKTGNISETRKN